MEKYFIFVEGGGTPKKGHATMQEAETECSRLATIPNTLNKKMFIFEAKKVYKNIPTLVNVSEEVLS